MVAAFATIWQTAKVPSGDGALGEVHPSEYLRGGRGSEFGTGPYGALVPGGGIDYVRTYISLVKDLAGKFRYLVRAGAILEGLDEDDAISDVVSNLEGKLEGEGEKVKVAGQSLVDLFGVTAPAPAPGGSFSGTDDTSIDSTGGSEA